MSDCASWDWAPGKRDICSLADASRKYGWVEEYHVSPDGERVAAVANIGEGEFTVSVNGAPWTADVYERIWNIQFSPDGRLTGYAADMGEWKLFIDDAVSEAAYGYLMQTFFSRTGETVACAVQQDMQYGMLLNGTLWSTLYDNANQFALSESGAASAAVVQTAPVPAADIQAFQQGCYSIAVNGQAWPEKFVNCWSPVFDRPGKRVAAQVRTSLYDYTIAVDGISWGSRYSCTWEPCFNPATGAVAAPVRTGSRWAMAQDEKLIWPDQFAQIWHQQFSEDGKELYAIVAPGFGKWTVARNGAPWRTLVSTMVCDLTVSPDGQRAAAVAKEGELWGLLVDDVLWDDVFPMVWQPVFSADSRHVATRVELPGKQYTFMLDGGTCPWRFDWLWDPVFSPDSSAVLIRGIQRGVYTRIVTPIEDIGAGG